MITDAFNLQHLRNTWSAYIPIKMSSSFNVIFALTHRSTKPLLPRTQKTTKKEELRRHLLNTTVKMKTRLTTMKMITATVVRVAMSTQKLVFDHLADGDLLFENQRYTEQILDVK